MLRLIETAADPACGARIVLVLSDQADAPALPAARAMGIDARFLDPGERYRTRLTDDAEAAYVRALQDAGVEYLLLAGFMRMVKTPILQAFPGRVVNIHPSLLPEFPGLDTHRRVLEAGARQSGCTVHFVDEGMDTGQIIAQAVVPVLPDDTEETLAARVLKREHWLYPAVLRLLGSGVPVQPAAWTARIFHGETLDLPDWMAYNRG
jgi:phosphoribosylglycinamide formyltransferase-1